MVFLMDWLDKRAEIRRILVNEVNKWSASWLWSLARAKREAEVAEAQNANWRPFCSSESVLRIVIHYPGHASNQLYLFDPVRFTSQKLDSGGARGHQTREKCKYTHRIGAFYPKKHSPDRLKPSCHIVDADTPRKYPCSP